MPPERRKPNSSALASTPCSDAARQQADDEAVEAVAGRRSRLQRKCSPCSMKPPASPPKRAGDEHRDEDRPRRRNASTARGQRIQADRAQPQAEQRALEKDRDDDQREHEQHGSRRGAAACRASAGQQRHLRRAGDLERTPAAIALLVIGWRSRRVDCTLTSRAIQTRDEGQQQGADDLVGAGLDLQQPGDTAPQAAGEAAASSGSDKASPSGSAAAPP